MQSSVQLLYCNCTTVLLLHCITAVLLFFYCCTSAVLQQKLQLYIAHKRSTTPGQSMGRVARGTYRHRKSNAQFFEYIESSA